MKVRFILKRVSLVLSVKMFFLISSSANESIVHTKYTNIKQETIVAMAAFANKLRFVESAGSQVIDSAFVFSQIDIHFGSWSKYMSDAKVLVSMFDSLVSVYKLSDTSDKYQLVVLNLKEEGYIQTAALPCFEAYHNGLISCVTDSLIIGAENPMAGGLRVVDCVAANFTKYRQCLADTY